jgi:hypothetical protein
MPAKRRAKRVLSNWTALQRGLDDLFAQCDIVRLCVNENGAIEATDRNGNMAEIEMPHPGEVFVFAIGDGS